MIMQRNSTTLFLVSPGATTPVLWVDNAPDFSGFTDPTLSVLVNSWQEFLDSGGELEIIPDPEPVPEPVAPNWPAFNFWLFTNQNFINYGLAANSVNPYLVPAIIERYGQIAKIGLTESGFSGYWDNFCESLQVDTEHREEWADKAQDFNLPADFVEVVRG